MISIKKCEFNIDTNKVDIEAENGTRIFIACDVVEDEYGITVSHRANLDYLLYNHPVDYVNLLLSCQMKDYLDKAASCTVNNKGIIIQGEKGAGKTTLLMHLLANGAKYLNNDITRVSCSEDELYIHAWPSKINIASETINHNGFLKKKIQENSDVHTNFRINPDDKKIEIQRKDFLKCIDYSYDLVAPLKLIIIPSFSVRNKQNKICDLGECNIVDFISKISGSWLPILNNWILDF